MAKTLRKPRPEAGSEERGEEQPQPWPRSACGSGFRRGPALPQRGLWPPSTALDIPHHGAKPCSLHQPFPKEQIFIVLGRKKKSPLLGSGSGNCY